MKRMQNMCTITPPAPIFCSSSSKIIKLNQRLLDHFRRSRDCTEHVQQAVKPLVPPRGRVLSREGFQWITRTKSIKKEKQSVSILKTHFEREKYLKYYCKN